MNGISWSNAVCVTFNLLNMWWALTGYLISSSSSTWPRLALSSYDLRQQCSLGHGHEVACLISSPTPRPCSPGMIINVLDIICDKKVACK